MAIELASGLSSGNEATMSSAIDGQPGFLIVETNYRVYAYTDNDLYLKIISLFCKMLYRFPKMCVFLITRSSIRKAFQNEISSVLILNFLKSHAHPEMRKRLLENKSLLPMTITDQIRLWEMERDRIKEEEGVLYNQFNSASDFEIIERYAKERNVLLWSSAPKRCIVVAKSAHDDVKRFWKKHRPKGANEN